VRARILSAIVTTIVVAAALVGYATFKPKADVYTLTAEVEQAPNLFEKARVMVRGVEVGRITAVEPTPDGVRLTLEIQSDVKIPADARMAVVPITVISDRYVQLYPQYVDGPTLADGDDIPLERTTIPAELDDVLTQLKGLLAALEPRGDEKEGPLARLIVDLDSAFKGRSDELAGTLEGSADVLQNLADSQTDITALIKNLDRLFVSLANRSSQIALLNERFAAVALVLQQDQADLEGTIENLAFLSEQGTALVEESGDSLGESFGTLSVVLDRVLDHQDSLARGIKWANAVAQALGATDASGRGRFAYSGRQASPGTDAAGYNYRLDGRDTVGCERLGVIADSILSIRPEASIADIRDTVLSFIPDTYDDDLQFLIDQLIPFCTAYQGGVSLDEHSQKIVRSIARRVGEERFAAMLTRWLVEGYSTGGSR
jgi:phospholipid/cholesterol/gamma-HCH transport system substrate-binding protein